MFTLDQLKRNQPHWMATAKDERRASMAMFDTGVVSEMRLPDPLSDHCPAGGCLRPNKCYFCLDLGERAAYWAKERRRKVRWWRKELANIAVEFARDLVLAAEAEGSTRP